MIPVSASDMPGLDPVAELNALARRLAALFADDPSNLGAARELRNTLLVLPGLPEDDPVSRPAAGVARRARMFTGEDS